MIRPTKLLDEIKIRTTMHSYLRIVVILGCIFIEQSVAVRHYGACAGVRTPLTCDKTKFTCLNGQCVSRNFFCDGGVPDCADASDELYCNANSCPPSFTRCSRSPKCIPEAWMCDGTNDCPSGEDESDCNGKEQNEHYIDISKRIFNITVSQLVLVLRQINTNSETLKWGPLVHKLAVVLYLTDPLFSGYRQQMALELSIKLLSQIAQKGMSAIPSSDLASFVNALLVTCLDPRDFYGFNIIHELRTRVNSRNFTNPYVLLTLCNAGDLISEMDEAKLKATFWSNNRPFWIGTQALVVMALSCARNQSGSNINPELITELTMELKQYQSRNGTVGNLQTTAMVMQALYSAESSDDPDNFDEIKALEYIMNNENILRSPENLIQSYYTLPVLNCKSLVNVSSSHCPVTQKDEFTAMNDLINRPGTKIRVQYSLWFGMQRDIERTLTMRLPNHTSLYGVMEIAAEIDSRYKFQYVVKDKKPLITALSGILEDAGSGDFWFPYILQDGQPTAIQKSTADVIPKDNDHFVMWYRRGTWED